MELAVGSIKIKCTRESGLHSCCINCITRSAEYPNNTRPLITILAEEDSIGFVSGSGTHCLGCKFKGNGSGCKISRPYCHRMPARKLIETGTGSKDLEES